MSNVLKRNIAANYFGKMWGIVAIYAFVPLYIRLLGIEAYGVIGFQTVLLAMAWVADGGLAPTFGREVSRSADLLYLRNLLCTMERVYLSICAIVAIVLVALSGWIATSWLRRPTDMAPSELQLAIALMAVGIGCQLAMSLYVGGLMGRQKQARANGLQIAYGVVRSALVLVPLYARPSLTTYFLWQAAAGLAFLVLIRRAMWQELAADSLPRFDWRMMGRVYKFAAGMFGIAAIAALNTQLDKLITSALFPLAQYAVYALASLAAQIPTMLTLPIALAVLPRMTALVEARDQAALRALYRKYSFTLATVAAASGVFIVSYAEELMFLWTRDRSIAAQASSIVWILTAGGVCLALQLMPYHLSIANGHNATNLRAGAAFLAITPLLTLWLASLLGLPGAALPWLLMNAGALVYPGIALTRRFMPGGLHDWILHDTLLPAGVCVAAGLGWRLLADRWTIGPDILVLVAAGAVLAVTSVVLFLRNARVLKLIDRPD